MRYHRGYVRTNDRKQSMDKFKDVPDEELKTLDEVRGCKSYAGVLAPGVVLVDFDQEVDSEIAYEIIKALGVKCRIYQSKRGYHFLFRTNDRITKNGAKLRLACGITADIKHGDSASYEVLKLKGVEREMIQDSDDPDEIPCFFTPMESTIELMNLGDGDGRNDVLYKYILPLQTAGYSRDECLTILDVVNRFVFSEPLDEREFKIVCRDDAFKPETEIKPAFVNEKGKFLHDVFAEWIAETLNVVKIEGGLYIYKDGIYVRGTTAIEREMIKHVKGMTAAQRKEVYLYLDLIIEEDHEIADARYIAFRNGIYDIVTDQLLPFSPDIILINRIPWDYDPSANEPIIHKVLNNLSCGNPKLFDLMCELVGYTFWRKSELGFAPFCVGLRANGKSTYLDTISYLLGPENTSALDFRDLGKDFMSPELVGKMANIGDDIADEYISDMSVFKKIATGNIISVNPKYEKPFKARITAKPIFSCNSVPRINDPTNAAARRIILIPFRARFDKSDPDYDPFIKYKLQTPEAMSTLINLAIAGLKRILANNDMTRCDEVEVEIAAMEERNNPVMTFIRSRDLENQDVATAYQQYTWWNANSGLSAMSRPSFEMQVKTHCGLDVINNIVDGKMISVFRRRD